VTSSPLLSAFAKPTSLTHKNLINLLAHGLAPVGLANWTKKSSNLLSIFPLRDDYKMKMQCAKQCYLPEGH
jgi:hypothetical protein